jgi:hypothetical protein
VARFYVAIGCFANFVLAFTGCPSQLYVGEVPNVSGYSGPQQQGRGDTGCVPDRYEGDDVGYASAPTPTTATGTVATLARGTAHNSSANSVHSHRPSTRPIGMPTAVPMTIDTGGCQLTVVAS